MFIVAAVLVLIALVVMLCLSRKKEHEFRARLMLIGSVLAMDGCIVGAMAARGMDSGEMFLGSVPLPVVAIFISSQLSGILDWDSRPSPGLPVSVMQTSSG